MEVVKVAAEHEEEEPVTTADMVPVRLKSKMYG